MSANTSRVLIAGIVLASALLSAHAQTTAPAPATTTPPASAPQRAPYVVAKFASFLNTKSIKTGDPVSAKILADLKLPDVDIPKGSKLVGTITEAQSVKDGNGTASLAIRFDHIDLKSGPTLKIAGLIIGIGEISNDPGLGPNSALGRGGVGSTGGLDPNLDIGNTGHKDEIALGSALPGVALGIHLDQNKATQLRGMKKDIKLDTDTEIKVALFRVP